jgi:hypothetical protein
VAMTYDWNHWAGRRDRRCRNSAYGRPEVKPVSWLATVHASSGNPHFPEHAGDYTHRLCQIIRFRCRLETALFLRGD